MMYAEEFRAYCFIIGFVIVGIWLIIYACNNPRRALQLFLVAAVALLFVTGMAGAASAEKHLRAAFVAEIDETNRTIKFVDSCSLIWEWELDDDEDLSEYELFDEFVFELEGETIQSSSMSRPVYSGMRVDKEWAERRIDEAGV